MKKVLISILCLLSFSLLTAQDDGGFKQTSGDKSLELQFDPGAIFNASNGNNVLSNGLGVRFRLFPSSGLAYRLNLNINYSSSNTLKQESDDLGNAELTTKGSDFGIFISPGIEKHFGGTKRLSPYIGAELNIGYHSSNIKDEIQAGAGAPVYKTTIKNSNPEDGLTIGAAAVAGADFYIAKKLYLGVELNYGVSYFMASKTKYTDTTPGIDDVETKVGKSNTFTFRPNALGVLRIGFLFGGGGSSSSSVSTGEF